MSPRPPASLSPVVLLVLLCLGLAGSAHAQAVPPSSPPAASAPGPSAAWQARRNPHPQLEVNLATGNLHVQLVTSSYLFGQQQPGFVVALHFNSQALHKPGDFAAGFALGPGWSSNLGGRLEFASATEALLTRGDGSEVAFVWDGAAWIAAAGQVLSLTSAGVGWVVEDRDHQRWQYDAAGQLQAIVSATGNSLEIALSGGQATSATGPCGRGADFGHDAAGRLASLTDSFGRLWSFTHDAAGRLQRIDDPEHGSIELTYDGAGRLDSLNDLDDNVWQIAHVASGHWQGRVESIQDPLGLTESYAYVAGAQHDTTLVTDTAGHVWTYRHDQEASPALASVENPLGQSWNLVHDAQRLPTSLTDPADNTWTATYDGQGRLLTWSDPLGRSRVFGYDALGNRTTETLAGHTTSYAYDDPLHPTLVTRLEQPGDNQQPGAVTSATWYGPSDGPTPGRWNGLLATLTSPGGVQSRFSYDDHGILRSVAEGPVGAGGGVEVHYDYDTTPVFVDLGGMQSPAHFPSLPGLPAVIEGHLHQAVEEPFDLDWRGQVRRRSLLVDLPLDSGSGWESSTVTARSERDHRGRQVLAEVSSDELHADVAVPPPGPALRSFTTSYDDAAADRPVLVLGPDGASLTVTHDAARRVAQLTVAPAVGPPLTIDYAYTPAGEVSLMTRSDGTSTELEYTPAGQLARVVQRSGNSVVLELETSYDGRGLPATVAQTSAAGVSLLTYDHDASGRLVREARSQPDGMLVERRFSYGASGQRLLQRVLVDGQLVEVQRSHHDFDDPLAYDSANGRLTWVERFDGGGALLDTTWLFHDNPFGHVSRLVRRAAGSTLHESTVFLYSDDGLPWLTWDERWTDDGSGPSGLQRDDALETRQDGWRQRLWRRRDGSTWAPLPGAEWVTRQDGLAASFAVDALDGSLSGLHLDVDGTARVTDAGHTSQGFDALGSLRLQTDAAGATLQELTAFGELLAPLGGLEHGLAGGFGVRQAFAGQPLSAAGLVLMGHRYYAPRLGRFLMRDPLGVFGGADVYAFAGNTPTAFVDPRGLAPHGGRYPGPPPPPPLDVPPFGPAGRLPVKPPAIIPEGMRWLPKGELVPLYTGPRDTLPPRMPVPQGPFGPPPPWAPARPTP